MERSQFALWALGFMTVVSAGALGAMLFFVDPTFADGWTLAVFYTSLFVAATGAMAWCFLFLRGRFAHVRRPLLYFFSDAVRQGALIAGFLTASLLLQARGGLNLLTLALLVASALILEALFVRPIRWLQR